MPKDYVKREKARRKPSRGIMLPPWLWVIFILIIALVLTFIYKGHVELKREHEAPITTVEPIVKVNQQATDKLLKNNASHVSFKFTQDPAGQSVALPSYKLQVGSFPQLKNAKDLQMRLKTLGYSAHIIDIHAGNQQWFRLQLGPYQNLSLAQQVQQQLSAKQIDGVVVRIED